MVDSFNGRKFGERSLESQDSRRGIGNSLEELLFSFERPGRIDRQTIIDLNGTSLTGLRGRQKCLTNSPYIFDVY